MDFGGLMSNPYVTTGLAIMAANKPGVSAGQAIGRGGLMGLAMVSEQKEKALKRGMLEEKRDLERQRMAQQMAAQQQAAQARAQMAAMVPEQYQPWLAAGMEKEVFSRMHPEQKLPTGIMLDAQGNRVIDPLYDQMKMRHASAGKSSQIFNIDQKGVDKFYENLNAREAASLSEELDNLEGKADLIESLDEATGFVDKGIYTGGFSDEKMYAAKHVPFMDKERAANTESFKMAVGTAIMPGLKKLGANPSTADLEFYQGISGGDITLEEGAIKERLASTRQKELLALESALEQAQSVMVDARRRGQYPPPTMVTKVKDIRSRHNKLKGSRPAENTAGGPPVYLGNGKWSDDQW